MRFLLILIVIVAVAVLLRGSWQAGRKPFYLTLSALTVAALIFIGAWLFTEQARRVPADPATVRVSVTRVAATETGFRLTGDIANQGEQAMAKVWLRADALRCPPATACKVVHSQEVSVPMHIPAGGRYPLTVFVDRPGTPIKADRWQLTVLSVAAYDD